MGEKAFEFAAAAGVYEITASHFGSVVERGDDLDRELHAAGEGLIRAHAPDPASLLYKLNVVRDHFEDNRDRYDEALHELDACCQRLVTPGSDLRRLAGGLLAMVGGLEREASDFDVRLLRSAARDMTVLASFEFLPTSTGSTKSVGRRH